MSHVIREQGRPWQIRMVNLQEVLSPLDIFRKLTGLNLQDIYNLLLKKGWTLGSPQLTRGMHAVIRLYHPAQVRMLRKFWQESLPDMVVSLVPNFNRALRESLPVPFATILTDIADYPPHFWIERQEQFLVCGSERAMAQALEMGQDPSRIFRTSGMVLNPRFYEAPPIDRRAERIRLGLDPDLPAALLLFGGQGSAKMTEIARRLQRSSLRLQLIAICGHNTALAGELGRIPRRFPMLVEGFTKEIPYYMQLSDFFIGKPGPGSISEALHMKLPVIVERNAWTLPQERYNADWIIEKQVGVVLRHFRNIVPAAEKLLEPENYSRFRANASAHRNRAVFEIPDILDKILETTDKHR